MNQRAINSMEDLRVIVTYGFDSSAAPNYYRKEKIDIDFRGLI